MTPLDSWLVILAIFGLVVGYAVLLQLTLGYASRVRWRKGMK